MRVLVSVTDKRDIVGLSDQLVGLGHEIVSTGGTAKRLAENQISVTPVEEVTNFPEMMGGRLKTLHPLVLGGILARRAPHEDAQDAERHGIEMFDIVIVNLYAFEKKAQEPGVNFDSLVEEIDIGGPTMTRAAAKNWRHVTVVVDPDDYDELVRECAQEGGISEEFRFRMMKKALAHTALYDGAITAVLAQFQMNAEGVINRTGG